MAGLDSDLLRTFLAIAESGSVTAGAARIQRSQSATSLQVKQLEDALGQAVFQRHGRGVVLTAAGERLMPVARHVVRTLDTALAEIRGQGLAGRLRLGLPDDENRARLSSIVAGFARQHPHVELDVRCALSAGFPDALDRGALDLAVYDVPDADSGVTCLRAEPMHWMAARTADLTSREPVPVALFDPACWWRDAALDALHAAARGYRIVYACESVAGVLAAVEAGVAVGLLNASALHDGLVTLPELTPDVSLPTSNLVLRTRGADTVTTAMADAIRAAFGGASRTSVGDLTRSP